MVREVLKFRRIDTPYRSIHSFIMEVFQPKEARVASGNLKTYASYVNAECFYVNADRKALPTSLQSQCTVVDEPPVTSWRVGNSVLVDCRVSFSNRGKDNHFYRRTPSQILKSFEERSGLACSIPTYAPMFLGVQRLKQLDEKSLNILNAFHIRTPFIVRDVEQLARALSNGVGSRKNYGFGLILICEKGNEK